MNLAIWCNDLEDSSSGCFHLPSHIPGLKQSAPSGCESCKAHLCLVEPLQCSQTPPGKEEHKKEAVNIKIQAMEPRTHDGKLPPSHLHLLDSLGGYEVEDIRGHAQVGWSDITQADTVQGQKAGEGVDRAPVLQVSHHGDLEKREEGHEVS